MGMRGKALLGWEDAGALDPCLPGQEGSVKVQGWGSPGWVDTARMGVRALKEPDGYEETVQRGVQT